MKKALFLLCIGVMVIAFGGATFPEGWTAQKIPKKSSNCGYRIIEYGIGLDCNGDTVKLVKSMGFQRLSTIEDSRYNE